MDYVWFKAVWNKLWLNFWYILVPKMAVLVQVELAGILCYASFVCMMFFGLETRKKSMLHVDFFS